MHARCVRAQPVFRGSTGQPHGTAERSERGLRGEAGTDWASRAPRDPEGLRRFFRKQMVRIQSDSVYHRVPVFKTLKRTSELAESIVRAAYEIAVAEASASAPPLSGDYTPANQMMVVALGRLGMLEFDLASDADLVFRDPGRRRARNPVLDERRRADDQRDQRLHGRWRGLHDRYAAAAERARRRAGADRERVQGLLRESRRSLGRNFVHEGARDRRRHRARHANFWARCRRSTGGGMGRAGVRGRNWRRCARSWKRNRGREIR